jgi:hypothetical protein
MRNRSVFSRLVRLCVYAGMAIASLASVPMIVHQAKQAMGPMEEEFKNVAEQPAAASGKSVSAGTISIRPAGPNEATQRQAELARLRAKLAGAPTGQ